MSKSSTMTFGDKFNLLVSIAKKRAGPLFEIDELVNEAWLKKQVRIAKDRKRFVMAVHWAMLDYVRNDIRKRKQFHRFLDKENHAEANWQ